ncbi:MAG: 50S ribosomal protein L2 [Candidatus Nanoarchaeia archaeon]|nr:50S ribosomal protein L2 [Candidatus Nanoarchaeia archaeon]MDD5357525.1 50S ribosomal protein L2 [Candidatus Nanoarchaeia archaeon]MDD5588444.1 50S ribosomal protein L2 [Candidatus Nanoarchaeia archaeon]
MGKRIIQQARGHGSFSYRVRRTAFKYKLKYPRSLIGEGTVINLLNSIGHSAPLAKIKYSDGVFYVPAFKGMIEGQKINFGGTEVHDGNIMELKNIPVKTMIYCIESRPGDGGIFIKTAGSSAIVTRITENGVFVMMPSKKEKKFNGKCRAIVGTIAGAGRLDKPLVKAGKSFYIKKSRNKLWPRTSAVKMNVIDHPFGSGRGKRIKSKIAKRNAPAGARVGLIRPRRTGKKKR